MEDRIVSNEEMLRSMVDSMLITLQSIANRTGDEITRNYAAKVVKLNRDMLARIENLPKAPEPNE